MPETSLKDIHTLRERLTGVEDKILLAVKAHEVDRFSYAKDYMETAYNELVIVNSTMDVMWEMVKSLQEERETVEETQQINGEELASGYQIESLYPCESLELDKPFYYDDDEAGIWLAESEVGNGELDFHTEPQ